MSDFGEGFVLIIKQWGVMEGLIGGICSNFFL